MIMIYEKPFIRTIKIGPIGPLSSSSLSGTFQSEEFVTDTDIIDFD